MSPYLELYANLFVFIKEILKAKPQFCRLGDNSQTHNLFICIQKKLLTKIFQKVSQFFTVLYA